MKIGEKKFFVLKFFRPITRAGRDVPTIFWRCKTIIDDAMQARIEDLEQEDSSNPLMQISLNWAARLRVAVEALAVK